jgi:hypothetical protein
MVRNRGDGDFGKPRADLLHGERAPLQQVERIVSQAIATWNNGLRHRKSGHPNFLVD